MTDLVLGSSLLPTPTDRQALDLATGHLAFRDLTDLVTVRASALTGPVHCDGAAPVVQVLVSFCAAAAAGTSWYLGPGPVPVHDGGPYLLLASSGSSAASGRGRVIYRTLESWTSSFKALSALTGLTSEDLVYLSGPLTGTMHLFAAVHTLAIGACLTDRPEAATATHCTPAVLAKLLATRPTSLRTAVVAGDRLPDDLRRRAQSAGIAVTEYYGAAEMSFVAAQGPAASAMTAFPGVSIRIVDGQLWARSPYLAEGYAAEYAAGTGRWCDGYVTVGDRAEWGQTPVAAGASAGPDASAGADAHASPDRRPVRILGRGDCAITVSGVTVFAEEIEESLCRLPGIRAVAVIGQPHPRLGATLVAVAELEPGADPQAIRASARAELTGAHLPRRFLATAALPRTAGGKIAREMLRIGLLDGSIPTEHF